MKSRLDFFLLIPAAALLLVSVSLAQPAPLGQSTSSSSSSSGSSSSQHVRKATPGESRLDEGSASQGVYRNPGFGFTCKIPAGWVLRTQEMNAQENDDAKTDVGKGAIELGTGGRVLLAAFSRPPVARGEDVNSSILIAAESAASYPGLKEAAQYFGPVAEVAKAQGFEMVDEPVEFAAGTKTIVRQDFQKNVGTRVMRQATLVMLARGYAISLTFIGGTEDEVEELIDGLSFGVTAKPRPN